MDSLLQLRDLYGRSRRGQGRKIMIEFGSLNIAKPFGAHHFLTTVIGQTLVNLYRLTGYEVLAGDYPGDWGTQFGKSIYAYRHWGDKDTVEKDPMNELLKLYVKFHEEAEKDPSLEEAARQEFQKLEAGDPENLRLWRWLVEVSTRDIDEIYRTMGVHHDRHYPESKYNQSCRQILERGKELGVITEGEKGAYIVNLDEENLPPALVQKGDGTTLYITRDLASIEDRLGSESGLERLVYVVDMAQTLHFRQLFAVAEKMHRADPAFPVAEFKHIPFGRMSFADASMSTRKGNIIQGREIIREAGERAERIVRQKMQENGQKFSVAETRKLVQGLAIGAIKYAMLCQAPESDFTFDWDRVISLDGNSAPYLQYSLARAHSILRRAAEQKAASLAASADAARGVAPDQKNAPKEGQTTLFSLEEEQQKSERAAELAASEQDSTPFSLPAEQTLLRLLIQYPERLAAAAENYKPNLLTSYLHELSQTFNSFYSVVPVLKSQRDDLRAARLDLVRATAQVLKNGLQALGIATFERM
jgi:arginyl-tRNA synthetase